MGMGETLTPLRQKSRNRGVLFPLVWAGTRNFITKPVGTFPAISHLYFDVGTGWERNEINDLAPYVPTFRTIKGKEYMEFLGKFFAKNPQKREQLGTDTLSEAFQ